MDIEAQPCCVCSTKTKNRCSACGAVGIDLFFCSTEHQKLVRAVSPSELPDSERRLTFPPSLLQVWKNAHSKVCGKNAVPFLPPDLTKEEAKQAVKLGRIDTRSTEASDAKVVRKLPEVAALGYHAYTIAGALNEMGAIPFHDFEMDAPLLLQNTTQYPRLARAEILRVARGTVHDILFQPGSTATLSLSPFYVVAPFQKILLQQFPFLHPESLVFDQLSHLALVLFTLLYHAAQPTPPPGFEKDFAAHALGQLQFAVSQAGQFRSKQQAENIVRLLATLAKPTLDNPIRYDVDPVTFKLRSFQVAMPP